MPLSSQHLQPVPLKAVTINDNFWRERIRVNREATIPIEYEQCRTTGRIEALTLAHVPDQHIFWDSDVAKWIEAAAYSLATHPDPAVDALSRSPRRNAGPIYVTTMNFTAPGI